MSHHLRVAVLSGTLLALSASAACDLNNPAASDPAAINGPAVPSAEIYSAGHPASHRLANRWLVVLDSTVADPQQIADSVAEALGGSIRHVYSHALKGFSADLPGGGSIRSRNIRKCVTSSRSQNLRWRAAKIRG